MTLNCKQGDFAIVVRCEADPSVIGKITRCVCLERDDLGEETWRIDPPIGERLWDPLRRGFMEPYWIDDSCLRPIRPSEGKDEMLRIAGKPQEVTA